MNPLRVLHVVTTMDFGGVETLLMTIYRNIDREKLQFDFLCHNRTESAFSEEIYSLGGKMYKVDGPSHGGFRKYIHSLNSFFKEHPEYQIIHCHNSSDNGIPLWRARKAGVKHRISHSHIAEVKRKFPYWIYSAMVKRLGNRNLTARFACSKEAGIDLFSKEKEFQILHNAINVSRFSYDPEKRTQLRMGLGLGEDTLLFGHVGRFMEQKNHLFLLSAFAEIVQIRPSAKLMLIGGGKLEKEIRAKADELNIRDHIIFAGQHSDLGGYYSAMDLFLFPSLYEGLGIVAVEAQCSGLPVIASDMVPAEAKVTDRMQFISLKESPVEWAKKCILAAEACRDGREACYDIVAKSHYNISTVADFLQNYYLSLEK